jgi:hypothetical protein
LAVFRLSIKLAKRKIFYIFLRDPIFLTNWPKKSYPELATAPLCGSTGHSHNQITLGGYAPPPPPTPGPKRCGGGCSVLPNSWPLQQQQHVSPRSLGGLQPSITTKLQNQTPPPPHQSSVIVPYVQ